MNEFNRINERFDGPMSDEDMDNLIDRQAEVQEKLDSMSALGSGLQSRDGYGRT